MQSRTQNYSSIYSSSRTAPMAPDLKLLRLDLWVWCAIAVLIWQAATLLVVSLISRAVASLLHPGNWSLGKVLAAVWSSLLSTSLTEALQTSAALCHILILSAQPPEPCLRLPKGPTEKTTSNPAPNRNNRYYGLLASTLAGCQISAALTLSYQIWSGRSQQPSGQHLV